MQKPSGELNTGQELIVFEGEFGIGMLPGNVFTHRHELAQDFILSRAKLQTGGGLEYGERWKAEVFGDVVFCRIPEWRVDEAGGDYVSVWLLLEYWEGI